MLDWFDTPRASYTAKHPVKGETITAGDIFFVGVHSDDLVSSQTFASSVCARTLKTAPSFETCAMLRTPEGESGGGIDGESSADRPSGTDSILHIEETCFDDRLQRIECAGDSVLVARTHITAGLCSFAVFLDNVGSHGGLWIQEEADDGR